VLPDAQQPQRLHHLRRGQATDSSEPNFKKKDKIFTKNWQKPQKIGIIISTPG
jgi:hypothetical protein